MDIIIELQDNKYINIPLVNSFDNSIVLEGYLTISDDSKDHWAHLLFIEIISFIYNSLILIS